jgi:hypothetical protein
MLVALLRQEKINCLARHIYRPIAVVLLVLDLVDVSPMCQLLQCGRLQ